MGLVPSTTFLWSAGQMLQQIMHLRHDQRSTTASQQASKQHLPQLLVVCRSMYTMQLRRNQR
jgi:hypothetical protein